MVIRLPNAAEKTLSRTREADMASCRNEREAKRLAELGVTPPERLVQMFDAKYEGFYAYKEGSCGDSSEQNCQGEQQTPSDDELCASGQEEVWPQLTEDGLRSALEAMHVSASDVAADPGTLSELVKRTIAKIQNLPSRPQPDNVINPAAMPR